MYRYSIQVCFVLDLNDLRTRNSTAISATRFARTGVTSAAAPVLSCRWWHLTYSRSRKPNQLFVTTCGLYVCDTFNHSLVTPFASYLGLRIHLWLLSPASFLRLRHKYLSTLVLPCACSIVCFGRPSSDLEVIASAFLGTSFMIIAGNEIYNIAEIPNENHLVVQYTQNFAYQSFTILWTMA